ncbi:MAG: nucleotidyltransferase domain-containing protein [Egibacteraceae bacterium]
MDPVILERLPAGVLAELERRDIAPSDVARALDVGPEEALLLTGSYATGEFNPTSDLDLLVLTGGRAHGRPEGATNHPSTFGDSFDVQVRDLVVNLEYVEARRVHDLCALVGSVGGSAQPDLPNLQPLEIRLIQRLAIGVPLAGADLVEHLRPALGVDVVRAAAAALNFVMALSLLEDTLVLEPPAQQLMCRGAAESLLLSGINAFGPITYDIKHLCSRAARLAEVPGAPRVLVERERVLFADREPIGAGRSFLLDLAVDLHRVFGSGDCPDRVAPMLEPFRAQWAWTDRGFG